MQELSDCEKENSQEIDRSAGCFGRLMADLFVYKEDMWEETLRRMGFFLGKYIYIMDAYEDLEEDLRKQCYNPLKVCMKEQIMKNRSGRSSVDDRRVQR